jgi:tetratricopeptide (TPR) repeat protein
MSMRPGVIAGAIVCAAALWMSGAAPLEAGAGEAAGPSAAWGELVPGPYGVGFRALEKYDYSRSFAAKKDYFGTPLPGERGRPVQVCIWYPAEPPAGASRMVYGEYAFVYPEDGRMYEFLSALQDREVGLLFFMFGNNPGPVADLQSEEMAAVRDAPVADGRFPLVLYAPHVNMAVTENLVLCEYLASHGYVVAATHAYGPAAVRSGEGASDLEVLVDDLGFVLAAMHGFDFVDTDRVGVLGSGLGGLAALLFQMENRYVDAVAGLNAGFFYPRHEEIAVANPGFDVRLASAPMLQIYGAAGDERTTEVFDSLEYSSRLSLAFTAEESAAFTSYRVFRAMMLGSDDGGRRAYETACGYIRNFFDAYLNGSDTAMGFLALAPPANGLNPAKVIVSRIPGREIPPTEEQFMAIITERGADEAEAIFRKFRAEDPDLVLFQENACNYAGYRCLMQGLADEAIKVFRMNTEAYPRSANTWDSLAEAYAASGDADHAAECYRRLLEVLPEDARASDDMREVLRNNAEQYLANPGAGESN